MVLRGLAGAMSLNRSRGMYECLLRCDRLTLACVCKKGKNESVSKAVPCQIAGLHVNQQAGEYTLSSEGRPACPGKYLRGLQAAAEARLMRVKQFSVEQTLA